MFASTHPQEFPPAILSRLQRFDVRRLTVPEITGKLERILAADGRDAEPEAVGARRAPRRRRDARRGVDPGPAARVDHRARSRPSRSATSSASPTPSRSTASCRPSRPGDAVAGIALLDGLEERGRDLRVFLDQVVDAIRERLLAGLARGGANDAPLVAAARRLGSIDPTRLGPGGLRLQLELALLDPRSRRRRPPPSPSLARPAPTPDSGSRPAAGPGRRSPRPASPRSRPRRSWTTAVRRARRPPRPSRPPPGIDPGGTRARAPTPRPRRRPPPRAEPGAPDGDLERLRHGWREVDRGRQQEPAAQAAHRGLPADRRRGQRRHARLPRGEGLPARDRRAEARRASRRGSRGFLGHPVGIRCVVSNLDLLPPLPEDADAAHILAEAQRIFAEDMADVGEVT